MQFSTLSLFVFTFFDLEVVDFQTGCCPFTLGLLLISQAGLC